MAVEIRRIEGGYIRARIDPDDKLPEVALVPALEQPRKGNPQAFEVRDRMGQGIGSAIMICTMGGNRYFTRLAVDDADVRMAAYILALESTTLEEKKRFTSDALVERAADVDVWHTLAAQGIATIAEPFVPYASKASQSGSDLYRGLAYVDPLESAVDHQVTSTD